MLPELTTTDHLGWIGDSWARTAWPEWVPSAIRSQVEQFWGCWGRNPRQWAEDAEHRGAPAFGSVVTLPLLGQPWPTPASGRFVHCWNNIGRIVHEDGSWDYVSFGHGDLSRLYVERRSPAEDWSQSDRDVAELEVA